MNYKMKCIRCSEDMKYIENKEMEERGFVAMDCPNGCEGGYLVPKNNPYLEKIINERSNKMNTVNSDNFNETMQGYFEYTLNFAKERLELSEEVERLLRNGLEWAKDSMTMEEARNYKR